jgi:hypothetical protein
VRSQTKKRTAVGCLLGCVAAWFCAPFILGWLGDKFGFPFAYPFDDRAFEQNTWMRDDGSNVNSIRGLMTADLITNYLKPGMSKAEVKRLLGSPDSQEKPDAFSPAPPQGAGGVVWCYHIGSWSGMRIDADFLAVLFDKSGVVVSAWHYQT